MKPVLYRVRTLLRTGWPATLTIAVVVAITGGLVLTLAAGAVRTITAPDRYVEWAGNRFDATANQESGGEPRDAEIAALPSVARVAAATFVFGGVIAKGSEEPQNALVFAGSSDAMGVRLIEGRQPRADEPGEFLATTSFVDATHAHVGSRFQLVTFDREQGKDEGFAAQEPKGPRVAATLVGILGGPAELDGDYAVALFPRSLLDEGSVGISATLMSVTLRPGADLADLRREVGGLPDGSPLNVQRADPISDDIRAAVDTQGQGLAILAAIVAAAAVAVIGQLLSRQYRLAETERTILGSLGFTRAQLDSEPVVRAAVAVGGGSLAAGALACAASGRFPRDFVKVLEPHPGLLLNPIVHIAGPVLLAIALSAWVLGSTIARPREGTQLRPAPYAERLMTTIPNPPAAIGLWFASTRPSGLVRSARVPFVGLALVVGLVFGAMTFGANLDRLVDDPMRYGENFDLALGQGGDLTRADVAPLVSGSDVAADVEAVTLYGSASASTEKLSFPLLGMDPLRGDLVPDVLSGRVPSRPDEIALGRKTADHLGVGIGDSFGVREGKRTQQLTVTGMVQPPPVGGSDLIGDAGVVTLAGFAAIAPGAPMNTAAVKLRPGAPADTRKRIEAALDMPAGETDRPPAIVNLARVRGIPDLVVGVVGLLATLSLVHQMLMAVRRRRVDLTILRALGATRRWLSGVVHWQATIIAAVVLAIGVPLGVAAGNSIYRAFAARAGARTEVELPLGWILAGALALMVLANIGAAIPARRARHLPPTRLLTER